MTDNQRTPADINAALAIGDEWTKFTYDSDLVVWSHSNHPGLSLRQPPNYCGDWNLAGPKMVELWEAGYDISYDKVDKTYAWNGCDDYGSYPLDGERDDMTNEMMATAYDYLAWREARAELARREGEK